MKCPYCNHPDTRVIDSRPAEDGSAIRRRRSCDECGKRFTTYEKVETIPLIIIKKDNNREQYNRSKIERGIIRACYKRPVSAEAIQKTVERIEIKIFNLEAKEVSSTDVGEIVMDELKELDEVAYVRFASVYRAVSYTHLDVYKRQVYKGGNWNFLSETNGYIERISVET